MLLAIISIALTIVVVWRVKLWGLEYLGMLAVALAYAYISGYFKGDPIKCRPIFDRKLDYVLVTTLVVIYVMLLVGILRNGITLSLAFYYGVATLHTVYTLKSLRELRKLKNRTQLDPRVV
ncbi:hypothetical protein [Thermococcus aciditolerans]|uniref:Uncharacterized protein n=1 Tax=Thermococcus aciditolerans TaxID=2598455 RepID=A0A5C0SMP9_9EURY|nr:hypothetical protein [Thermococcus aciditolerans]QEK14448.1 hypothetical protein FPV09_04275 [Thermococcus aciditolerans]